MPHIKITGSFFTTTALQLVGEKAEQSLMKPLYCHFDGPLAIQINQ